MSVYGHILARIAFMTSDGLSYGVIQGLVTPEWAKRKAGQAEEAVTAPPLMQPDSAGRPSRGPVARRLNIDQVPANPSSLQLVTLSCAHSTAGPYGCRLGRWHERKGDQKVQQHVCVVPLRCC